MYQLAIIGGGPAGYTAAHEALKNGMNVILFEQQSLGGVCLNEGCIPTKTLLYSAKQFYNTQNAEKYGVSAENIKYNWSKIQQRKTRVIRKLQAGIRAKLNNPNCKYVNATAVVRQHTDTCVTIDAGGEIYEAEKLLICTGSTNFVPPIQGIDSPYVINSTEALNMTELPQSIIIIGGGVIGMEFATLYHELGVKVTIVEALPQILNNLDDDITDYISQKYRKAGLDIYTNAKVIQIDDNNVKCLQGNNELTLQADKILVCVGRRPNLQGLENLNLTIKGRGIGIDIYCQTSLPNVYAAGDVTGEIMLAHVASEQASIAINVICGIWDKSMHYNCVPSVIYTNPEIAAIGSIPSDADANTYIKKIPLTYSGRFVSENEGENGLCKMAYTNSGYLLGVQLIGNYASEIISSMSAVFSCNRTVETLENIIFPHPTVSEIFKETLLS